MSANSDFDHRLDVFEPEDQTALICVDIPDVQRQIVADMETLKYKIHTGLFAEDAELKLQTHPYDVVIISEHYNSSNLETNPLLLAAVNTPSGQRRRQMFILVGPSLHSDSEMEAWAHSVDLVVGVVDIANFKHVFRRASLRHKQFYTSIRTIFSEAGLA